MNLNFLITVWLPLQIMSNIMVAIVGKNRVKKRIRAAQHWATTASLIRLTKSPIAGGSQKNSLKGLGPNCIDRAGLTILRPQSPIGSHRCEHRVVDVETFVAHIHDLPGFEPPVGARDGVKDA